MKHLLILLLLSTPAWSAPRTESLGNGLIYVRVHTLPQDLPPAEAPAHHAWILDLRYVKAGDEEAALVESWVRVNAAPAAPVFILFNPDSSTALTDRFAGHAGSGVITVGPQAAGLAVDIPVSVKPETERKAYDALEHGSTVAALTTDFPGKPRMDEEKLAHDHLQDSQTPEEPVEDPKHPTPPPPLIDLTLQRALHLDRGLIALRKLPS